MRRRQVAATERLMAVTERKVAVTERLVAVTGGRWPLQGRQVAVTERQVAVTERLVANTGGIWPLRSSKRLLRGRQVAVTALVAKRANLGGSSAVQLGIGIYNMVPYNSNNGAKQHKSCLEASTNCTQFSVGRAPSLISSRLCISINCLWQRVPSCGRYTRAKSAGFFQI